MPPQPIPPAQLLLLPPTLLLSILSLSLSLPHAHALSLPHSLPHSLPQTLPLPHPPSSCSTTNCTPLHHNYDKRGPIANTYIDPINPVWLATLVLFGAFLCVAAALSVVHARSVRQVERLLKAQQQHIELDDFVARSGGGGGGGGAPPPPFAHAGRA